MPETISKWRSVTDYPGHMSNDGNAHFAYYDSARLLSFIWDGDCEWIEVSHGGYGEPVEWIIPAFVFHGTPGECVAAFELYCLVSLDEWDETIWDDAEYAYHEWPRHCAANEKLKGIPLGKPYIPWMGYSNGERKIRGEE